MDFIGSGAPAVTEEAHKWAALYADHLPRIYNYVRFRCGQEAEAEDLTSLVFEKAWRSRARYRKDLAAFSTWLFKIARNTCTDHLRRQRDHRPLEDMAEAPALGTPLEAAERASDLAKLSRLSARLSERERELISLKFGADLGNRRIAQLTGLSESNVGVILHRAVQQLRALW